MSVVGADGADLALLGIQPERVRAELGAIRQGRFRSRDGEFTQTTELTNAQRDLHRTLEIPEPPRFGRITPA